MDCYELTGHSAQLVFTNNQGQLAIWDQLEPGTTLVVRDEDGHCAGTADLPAEPENFAFPIWGHDTISEDKSGMWQNEGWTLYAVMEDGSEVEVGLNLREGGAPYRSEQVYMNNALYVAEGEEGAVLLNDPTVAELAWASPGMVIDPGSGAVVALHLTSDAPLVGMRVQLNVNGTPTSGTLVDLPDAPHRMHTVLSDTDDAPDTLRFAAVSQDDATLIGGDRFVRLTVEAPADGLGSLQIAEAEAITAPTLDGSPAPIDVVFTAEDVVEIMAVLKGDVTGTGTVSTEDLVAVMKHLVWLDRLTDEQRPAADVYPFPDGNEAVGLRDAFTLARSLHRGTWPDGSPTNPEIT